MTVVNFVLVVTFYVGLTSISNALPINPNMKIESEVFGTTSDNQKVIRYTLVNSKGYSVSVMNFGATLLEVMVPDREGDVANVNLCFESFSSYESGHPYFGSSVGRFCNRIGEGKFQIDGADYQVTLNSGKHHLHGGKDNFSYRLWDSEILKEENTVGVCFTIFSKDGDEGYPGNLTARAVYKWNDENELTIEYSAETDAPTHVNLTNHSYWNLAGAGSGSVMGHITKIYADQWLDVDVDLIPSGIFNPVEGTPLDFREARCLGERISDLPNTKGYDHCYVVRGESGTLRSAAEVVDPVSGRKLEIETTQPGMQLYTANHLPGNERSNGYQSHHAFCLETQHFPNTPNISHFPTTLLRPGRSLRETTVHRFGVQN
jgi:aldose 1-epimerase